MERAVCSAVNIGDTTRNHLEGTEKQMTQTASVLKAELTFVELGGVETLIADPTAGSPFCPPLLEFSISLSVSSVVTVCLFLSL